ncbi:MAG: Nif3-like dinuclear metal center hexameric protein [Flavobacteriales bacterium]|nr:Nif3-like dinuclear metal center hexameric protein [Flavobacteriales bacterium]
MKVKEVINYLEQLAPKAYQENYDNAGLITGSMDMELKGTMVCLDSTEEVIDEAIEKGANLVIAHHPIVFSGIKQLNGKNYVERTVIKAIKNDIAIYAIHTNLDNVRGGVNEEIADRIGLKKEKRKILMPKKGRLMKLEVYVPHDHVANLLSAMWDKGAGQIGLYDECSYRLEGRGTYRPLIGSDPYSGVVGERSEEQETKLELIFSDVYSSSVLEAMHNAHPYESVAYQLIRLENSHPEIGSGLVGELPAKMDALRFLETVKDVMGAGALKHTEIHKRSVEKIAVLGGSGVFGLGAAKAEGADVLITGDVKYHEFFDAENDIILVDIGHYESEAFTQQLLQGILAEKFPKFAHLLTGVNTNPVKYL